ncbi:hypothetical protein C8R45DRAFT_932487 [Mycena sanguinolenta]|nr:hypothetical protein C8R45DRAFT_932487 [Mycena sanguinolenta]
MDSKHMQWHPMRSLRPANSRRLCQRFQRPLKKLSKKVVAGTHDHRGEVKAAAMDIGGDKPTNPGTNFEGKFLLLNVTGINLKRGLGPVPGSESDLVKASSGQCSWFYNWSPNPPSSDHWGSQDIESFADIIHKIDAKTILERLNKTVVRGLQRARYAGAIEHPSFRGSAAVEAAHPTLKYAGIRLGSPAVSNRPNGLQWLNSFMKACTGCTIDFIAVHWRVRRNSRTTVFGLRSSLIALQTPKRALGGLQSNLLDGNGNLNALGSSHIVGSSLRARRAHARRRRLSIGT